MRGRPYGLAKKEKGERYGKTGNSGEAAGGRTRSGDERERTIRMEGESFSLLFVFLMGLILLDLEAGPWAAA